MPFQCDEQLANSSIKIYDAPLSEVRLKNNRHFPWIILIPRVEHPMTEIFDLNENQQRECIREITHIAHRMKTHFQADKMNVGALSNIVSQLHIHIIARFINDLAWPHSLWQAGVKDGPYSPHDADQLILTLKRVLQ